MFESDFGNLILEIISTLALFLIVSYTIFDDIRQDAFMLVLFIIMSIVMIKSIVMRIVKFIKSNQKAD
ncbi:hypothetical protein SFC02_10515 [Terribacillus goriensis]|uniref:hypothetical protein n=1 Tax=Terribacillus saccharophilus TaxID=361277 RepID=UPI003982E52D